MSEERPDWCVGVPHGPDEPCTCTGCWACKGAELECSCDIDWSCVYGDCTCPRPDDVGPYWNGKTP